MEHVPVFSLGEQVGELALAHLQDCCLDGREFVRDLLVVERDIRQSREYLARFVFPSS